MSSAKASHIAKPRDKMKWVHAIYDGEAVAREQMQEEVKEMRKIMQ